ncbi:hypothetical protein OAG1_41060 [Agarivorans sp. OAG1]|uniref:tripartite tricarboxylate transporter TctB family protein n=1 Tax=Agarivorans sp. OAG1 TaxID=3082387 RepID=UPI002B2CC7A8|nr:hypothetical protein OAG1_41060 [Agarivorans sp. OAG1]
MNSSKPETASRLRQTDFKIALVLLALCALLAWETLSFPMSGSFGGVDSRWYVSPALFPFILLLVLSIASSILLVNAIRSAGHREFFKLQRWLGDNTKSINRDRWYVIAALCLYIYLYVPSLDFYLATVMFLLSLCLRFYTQEPLLSRIVVQANLALGLFIFAMRWMFAEQFYWLAMDATVNETLILASDIGAVLAVGVCLLCLYLSPVSQNKRRHILLTVLAVPLLLVFSFNFLLQVPMPVEYGSVIKAMEFIWYELLGL